MIFSDLNLNAPLLNALKDLGLEKATTIQHKAFSVIMSGKDVVGLAQTGTGKTYAYILPILRMLKFSDQKDPRVLIVVPTRELVLQVVGEFEKMATYMNIRVKGVYGGTNIATQKIIVHEGMDVLVATPGRLIDLALSGVLRLRSVRQLVIDEVDEMLNLGFRTQLDSILGLLSEKRQNLMFSATMTEDVELLIQNYFQNPQKIEAAAQGTPLEKIAQTGYHVPNFYTKVNLLTHLLENNPAMSKVLVFTATKKLADLLYENLEEAYAEIIGVIHSNKSQNNRILTLEQFEKGNYRILIATDLVARGLDISDVTHVINFDLPDDPLMYLHRIGRTGRADKGGDAITLVTPWDEDLLEPIETYINLKVPVIELPDDLKISEVLLDDEKHVLKGVVSILTKTKRVLTDAYHEKKKKNKKVNLGGSYKRTIKLKYKKPKTRGMKIKEKK